MAVGTLKADAQTDASALETYSGASASGQAVTVSTGTAGARKLKMVTVKYSGAASVTATVTLNSYVGAAYDTLLQNITFSAGTDAVFIPTQDIPLQDGDAIDVLAPAVTSQTGQVVIYTERL